MAFLVTILALFVELLLDFGNVIVIRAGDIGGVVQRRWLHDLHLTRVVVSEVRVEHLGAISVYCLLAQLKHLLFLARLHHLRHHGCGLLRENGLASPRSGNSTSAL